MSGANNKEQAGHGGDERHGYVASFQRIGVAKLTPRRARLVRHFDLERGTVGPNKFKFVYTRASSIGGLSKLAIFAGFEQGFDFFSCERFDRCFFKTRSGYAFHQIKNVEFRANPAEKGREVHPYIADSLVGERGCSLPEKRRGLYSLRIRAR